MIVYIVGWDQPGTDQSMDRPMVFLTGPAAIDLSTIPWAWHKGRQGWLVLVVFQNVLPIGTAGSGGQEGHDIARGNKGTAVPAYQDTTDLVVQGLLGYQWPVYQD